MKKIFFIFVLIAAALFNSCREEPPINSVVADNIDEQIGQMLMIGFRGFTVEESSHIARDIQRLKIGGVVLYDKDVESNTFVRNIQSPEQLKQLTAQLQSLSMVRLLIAADQEGGRVSRLKTNYGFPATVSQQYLGDLNNPDTTRFYADRTAVTLQQLGINLNLAPVVDVNVNPANPVIGALERSFSANTDIVTQHSLEVIKKHNEHNVLTAIKHFPGHGSSQSDSHLGFTDVTNTWSAMELQPFYNIINAGRADVIMTAHIYNAHIDSVYPATLSQKTLGILRDYGYNGVIISDDMQMRAITDHYGLEEAIYNFINAGGDILIFSNNSVFQADIAQQALNIVKSLIERGKISRERIKESYNRIMDLKARLN